MYTRRFSGVSGSTQIPTPDFVGWVVTLEAPSTLLLMDAASIKDTVHAHLIGFQGGIGETMMPLQGNWLQCGLMSSELLDFSSGGQGARSKSEPI
uniref:Uncharacterized protein n=1 Tax=Peronospora matthiolae TaxID=2874970 RepID=A0AAV1V648_9STRA